MKVYLLHRYNSIGFNFDRERQEIYKAKKYIENIVESNRIYEERKDI